MEINKLISILKEKGKVLVKLLDNPWDEAWGEKGMIAELSYLGQRSEHEFLYDYNKHKEHNLTIQGHDWWLKGGATGTAFEAGIMKEDNIHETVYHSDDVPVEIIENGFLAEYINSGCKTSYVKWLEDKLTEMTKKYE